MASQDNGGQTVAGNLQVFGDCDCNGDSNVDGSLTVTGAISGASVAAASATLSAHIKLTPTADPPGSAAEGMLYADTDNKLYYYNGTTWKEVAFV